MDYTADQVWALAVRADQLNGGYLKEPQGEYQGDRWIPTKQANKVLVKTWLRENQQPTNSEVEQGRVVRNYFNGFMLKEIAGTINDFERQALKIAQIDNFTGRDLFEFAVVSCLPSTMRRDQTRRELDREIQFSTQLEGSLGDSVVGDITVISSNYSQEYGKSKIHARMGESFVDFWFKDQLAAGEELRIKGKIKAQRSNNTTQLNYVKKA